MKAEPKSIQNVNQTKLIVTPTNTPVAPEASTHISTEPPQDPSITPDVATPKQRSKEDKDLNTELKAFAVNFQVRVV